jgi:S-DNA-T family DNA segregation ATPase FtsK/SpoIIIE
VNLVIATQRPTQKAMGHNAVRSQIDIRICLRVREPRDVDLVLWQGAYTSGWRATMLDKPGVYFVSSPEYTQPERARGYLVPNERVTRTATAHATARPTLDPYPSEPRPPDRPQDDPEAPHSGERDRSGTGQRDGGHGTLSDADAVLWAALVDAGPDGATIGELMSASGMPRRTLYRRLTAYAEAGRAVRTAWGRWRAVDGSHGSHGPSRPSPRRPDSPRDVSSSRTSRAARARRRRADRRPPGRQR